MMMIMRVDDDRDNGGQESIYDHDGGSNHDHRGQIGFLLCLYCVSLNVFFFVSNLIRILSLIYFLL